MTIVLTKVLSLTTSDAEYHGAKIEAEVPPIPVPTTRQQMVPAHASESQSTRSSRRHSRSHRHSRTSSTSHEVRPVIHAPPRDHQRDLESHTEETTHHQPRDTDDSDSPSANIACPSRRVTSGSRRNTTTRMNRLEFSRAVGYRLPPAHSEDITSVST